MSDMEQLLSRFSRQIADGPVDEIWISKFEVDYAYGKIGKSNGPVCFRRHRRTFHRIVLICGQIV